MGATSMNDKPYVISIRPLDAHSLRRLAEDEPSRPLGAFGTSDDEPTAHDFESPLDPPTLRDDPRPLVTADILRHATASLQAEIRESEPAPAPRPRVGLGRFTLVVTAVLALELALGVAVRMNRRAAAASMANTISAPQPAAAQVTATARSQP